MTERSLDSGHFVGDVAAARAVLRGRRNAVDAASWGQIVQDWYVGIFIAATLLTMVFAATGPAILSPDCDTVTCLSRSGYRALATGLAVAGVIGVWAGLRSAGPASSDPGRATWLLSTPADRGVLLRGAITSTAFVAVVVGSLWGALVGIALAGGSGHAGGALPVVLSVAGGGLLATLVLIIASLHGQGGSVLPARSARAVGDAELARAGQVVQAVSASTLMLSGTALQVLAARRRLARRGRYVSGPGAGGCLSGLLVHELRALRRRAGRVLVMLAACLGALAVGLLMGRLAGVIVAALAVFVAARTSGGGVGMWVGSPGLRRSLPAHPAAVTAVLVVPPFAVALIGSVIALLGLGLAWYAPVLLALGATAGTLRSQDPPPGLGVVVSTPAGAVQTGLVAGLVLGTDLALASAAAVLIADAVDAGPLVLVLGVALLAWQVLRSRD
ncbi:hypothetical protein [Janibacter cremeus]|uniref:Uncharacterized protein n=1 Tax=Janibacter cremeus TaxID=1285192 RepID=A0A852VPD9_9MICO|nr:hypothetical protein [Janibacter cremeus]NYF98832.1 hypothetical protein [Janibacter cremeus]